MFSKTKTKIKTTIIITFLTASMLFGTLAFNQMSMGSAVEQFEENNTFQDAHWMGNIPFSVWTDLQFDDDWFNFTVPADGKIEVVVESASPLWAELVSGAQISLNTTTDNGTAFVLTYEAVAGSTFWVHVSGTNTGMSYNLHVRPVGLPPTGPNEPNDDFASPFDMGGIPSSIWSDEQWDVDIFKFMTTAAMKI